MTDFSLQKHLDDIYDVTTHRYEFRADQRNDALRWQQTFRSTLRETLKIAGRQLPENLSSELLSSTDKGSYIEEKHNLDVDGVATPMYVLIPKTEPPYKPMIAFHGHGMGVNMILGNYEGFADGDRWLDEDNNYAQRFAEDGYLVCAVEQQGFGERVTHQMNQPDHGNSCRHMAFMYLAHDRVMVGERVWDGMNAISYLLNRDDVIANKLSCVGLSGGGTTTLFISALDERIKKVIVSGYFCAFSQSIFGMEHCECNYVPDLLTLGEAADIGGLIAPRPLLIQSGEIDPIFPIEGVREQYARLERIYQVFEAEGNCAMKLHPYAHRFHYDMAKLWMG